MGLFITFEGIEGCGKTTQIKMVGKYLDNRNISYIITEEPGGSSLGLKIREILLNKSSFEICAESELFLFSAARAQHVKEVILPALEGGEIVLCDRFFDATIAYQGSGRELDMNFIRQINAISAGHLKPDMTFLFDIPVEIGLKRAMGRISRIKNAPREDRFESEKIEFHKKVREGYLSLAKSEPERFRVIDGTKDILTVHREVCSQVVALIDGRG
ncbi:MAG: dTMP kinase [Proteobacteria bacterium]|nr:dTMP kinase [Pseudomonadota bacterium]